MEISKKTLNTSQHTDNLPGVNGAHYSVQLFKKTRADNPAEKLKAIVNNTPTFVRGGKEEEVSLKM